MELEEFEELKSLLYKDSLTQYGKRKLIEIIEKQQKEIERIREYVHQEIVLYTESIEDYIDDGKEENKDFIGELKEEREHWKDIERILHDKPNEQLYMNWWNYGLYE